MVGVETGHTIPARGNPDAVTCEPRVRPTVRTKGGHSQNSQGASCLYLFIQGISNPHGMQIHIPTNPKKNLPDNVLNICLDLQLTIDMARQAYVEILACDDEPLMEPHHADWLLLEAVSTLEMLGEQANEIIDLRNRLKKKE